jgi:hypothetical protein
MGHKVGSQCEFNIKGFWELSSGAHLKILGVDLSNLLLISIITENKLLQMCVCRLYNYGRKFNAKIAHEISSDNCGQMCWM